jgi:hypothetical protein
LAAIDWSALGEIVKVLGAVSTAGAAWFAAATAYEGLRKWRAETVGKRRYDLATTTLTFFYEAEEIVRSAREPWVLPREMAPKEGIAEEVTRDPNFAPEARLLQHQEFFAKFRALRHEFAAVFGKDAAKPFDEVLRVRLDINHAVDLMLRNKDILKSRDPEDRKLWESFYWTAFRHHKAEQDPILVKIHAQIAAIEATCRPAIAER